MSHAEIVSANVRSAPRPKIAPVAGTKMLVAHHSHYGVTPSLHTCHQLMRICNQRMTDDSISTYCQEAVWALLQQMPSPALPKPTVDTFVLATECAFAGPSVDDVPLLHHALVLLQQNVWSRMHHVLGCGADTMSAYDCYLTKLSNSHDVAAEAVQTVLLMAQNGLAGVSSAACVALVFTLNDLADPNDEQTQWMQDTFGAEFVQQVVQAVEDHIDSDEESDNMEGLAVSFPSQYLPKVSQVELADGSVVFALQLGFTPFWMWSSVARQDPHFVKEMQARQIQVQEIDNQPDTVPDTAQLTAAEQLVAQYGQIGKGNRNRGR